MNDFVFTKLTEFPRRCVLLLTQTSSVSVYVDVFLSNMIIWSFCDQSPGVVDLLDLI